MIIIEVVCYEEKNISLFVLMILIGILMLNDKNIKIFANNLGFQDFEVGTIAKSGDLFYNDISDCYSSYSGYCSIDMNFRIYNPETGEYKDYQNIYFEFDYNKKVNGTNYMEIPQYNGKDVDWIAYYKEDRGSVGISVVNFYFVDYQDPKFNITCDTDTLHEKESTECEIKLEIMSDVENITCDLTSEELEINDIYINEEWTTETKDYVTTLSYKTASKTKIERIWVENGWGYAYNLVPVRAQELNVGKFKVTATTPITEASMKDIISLSNCEVKDNYKEDKIEDTNVEMTIVSNTITTTQKKKKRRQKIQKQV